MSGTQQDIAQNPLLAPSGLPHDAVPFDRILPEHFMPALTEAIRRAHARIAAIKADPAPPTFQNTVEALEVADIEVGAVASVFSELVAAKKVPGLKDIQEAFESALVAYGSEVSMDEGLFARIRPVYESAAAAALDADSAMLLKKSYKGFVRGGAMLDPVRKARLKEIDQEMSRLTTAFEDNVIAGESGWEKIVTDEALLAGVPERVKARYRADAADHGRPDAYRLTISPPPGEVMEYAENRALREELWRALRGVAFGGAQDNCPLVLDIVRLRHERARLLGYDTHAHFVLDGRMAGDPQTVLDFLERNRAAYRPAAEKELAELKTLARDADGVSDFSPWDYAFYYRRLRESRFDFDAESTRAYFALEDVVFGLNAHAERLFDIKMQAADGRYPAHDPEVRVFEVRDNKKDGAVIGLFYADYYARPGLKQPGAWMQQLRGRACRDGADILPISTNSLNIPRPPAGRPTLLSVDEVRTLFHEFGHALHNLLAEGRYASLTGTSVETDFVELPSQVQENWALEKEVLDTFARHHETGDKIPAELVEKIRAAENFGGAYAGLRQTFLGMLDMQWHAGADGVTTVEALEAEVMARASLFPPMGGAMSTSFTHLFGSAVGYSSGYYGYKWAEVLDADVFAAFKDKGLYDRALGDRLRRTIYAPGGTREPADLYRDMMGRNPDPDALFRREGIAVT